MAEQRPAAQGARAGLPRLTLDAAPETVLGWARIFARRFTPFGALEPADLASDACVAFYVARERWRDHIGDFGAFAAAYMRGAMGQALRREARAKGDWRPRPSAPGVRTRRRSPGSRARHNQTYYLRTRGLQMCEVCGEPVGRGHGARRCDAHATPAAVAHRAARARAVA